MNNNNNNHAFALSETILESNPNLQSSDEFSALVKKGISSESQLVIIRLLYEVIRKLGGKSDILSIVGSIGDTISDKDAIDQLESYIKSL